MRTRWASLALLAAVAGCGADEPTMYRDVERARALKAASAVEVPRSPEPSTPIPGPGTFIADARALDLGDKDMQAATDEAILGLGRQLCRMFDTEDASTPEQRRANYEIIVQAFRTLAAGATEADARTLTTSAIVNLCPINADVLPPAAAT